MKTSSFFSLAVLSALPALTSIAAAPAAEPQAAYRQAVASYLEAADEQVKDLRVQVDEALKRAGDDAKPRFASVYEKLDAMDTLVEKLRTSGPEAFDKLKAQYERTRAEMLQEFARARLRPEPGREQR